MINVDMKAKVKEIQFLGDTCCVFVVENDKSELVCTITKKNIHLTDLVKEGQEIELKGIITAYRKVKNEKEYINNVLYIDHIAKAEQEQKAN